MAPLTVDPAALGSAGTQVVTAGQGLGSAISTLTSALAGCSGMAGDDPVGASFGHGYDGSAAQLVKAMVATRNGLCGLGDGVRMSAHNYSLAEAQSNITGGGDPLPAPAPTGPISAGAPSSSVGAGAGAPAGWGWVAPFIGMIWPTGDSGKLRASAAAWGAAGTQFGAGEILGTGAPMEAIRAQQIPEGPAIDKAFADAYASTTGIVHQCQQIAANLNSYAAKIDNVHASILDLLSRICDPMTGIKEVWDFLTDEDEDEIKKIADDIRTVVDNFAGEVDALQADIAAAVAEAAKIASTMEKHAAKQWDQFLHGTDIGRLINLQWRVTKGFGSEAGGFLKGFYTFSGLRLTLDPNGFSSDLKGVAQGAATLVGLGPDGAPGVVQSWEAVGKQVTHWDEWKTDPAGALGRSELDVLTMFLPGGALSKLGIEGRVVADVAKGLKPAELPKIAEVPKVPEAPKVPEVPHGGPKPPEPGPKPPEPGPKPPEPGPKPPEPGRPSSAPPPKPGSAPGEGSVPHGPTESRPPVAETPHTGEPKPVAAPSESSKPAAHAPAAHAPAAHPHEPAPARVPAAAMQAASAPSLPSLPEPPSLPKLPTGALPTETPPVHGTPHSGHGPHHPGESGGHPSEQRNPPTHDPHHEQPKNLDEPTGDPATAHLPPLRQHYIQDIQTRLPALETELREAGASEEKIARAMQGLRREIGQEYKDLTPEPLREQIYGRNLTKYGDPLGPTYDYLKKVKGLSDARIIEGSKRTGGSDLGLGAL